MSEGGAAKAYSSHLFVAALAAIEQAPGFFPHRSRRIARGLRQQPGQGRGPDRELFWPPARRPSSGP
eukprot:11217566-Lingulodinium_polyedra.AAC.1